MRKVVNRLMWKTEPHMHLRGHKSHVSRVLWPESAPHCQTRFLKTDNRWSLGKWNGGWKVEPDWTVLIPKKDMSNITW